MALAITLHLFIVSCVPNYEYKMAEIWALCPVSGNTFELISLLCMRRIQHIRQNYRTCSASLFMLQTLYKYYLKCTFLDNESSQVHLTGIKSNRSILTEWVGAIQDLYCQDCVQCRPLFVNCTPSMLLVIKRLSVLSMQMLSFLFVITIYLPLVGHIPPSFSGFIFPYIL